MQFRILGDLDFLTPRQGHVIVRGKKMELLAILLLRANETVSLDSIVEGMWGSRPPRSAIRNVRTYAWQLRCDLGAEAYRLSGSPGGYRILCKDSELDFAIFQALSDEGFRSARAGDSSTASEKLQEALSCWRGDPFGGISLSQYLQAEVDWLQERRLTVFEELMGALLVQGAYYEVIERTGREIIRHPLREGLYEKLMHSLLRTGRSSEALAAYKKATKILKVELGVEPGDPLQGMYRKIISGSRIA
jgi:DNA-binding SARP family transcriptional activator